MPTITVNGIRLYYERSGEGPRLLFCNGSGSTIEGSRIIIDPFARRFDVAVHDQRGLGQSEIPPGPYTMTEYAADAAGLLDALGWDTCRVVGISFGGMVAQELAVTFPERVERLALLCTSPGGPGFASYPLHELMQQPQEEAAATALKILDTRFTPEWLAEHESDRNLVELLTARRLEPKTEEQLRGEAGQLEARARHDVLDRLDRITCPTFVGAGRYDGIAPLPNSEAIVARVPNAELHVYEGGHAFFGQDPAAFPEILDFLAG